MARCTECSNTATRRGRCDVHDRAYQNRPSVRARRSRGRRAALYNAAVRLRRTIDRKGSARCAWCLDDFPACEVEVDHLRPLATGGTDTGDNVHVLCRECHQLKTATEFGTGGGSRWSERR
ncbi:HNH endonuclease [Streptomyces sp. SID12501]|uniref:HNH endonuclease n=1 Tax=Streptomyces sp. SID12501 TaxID=2706042 RepID=A0A6B3C3Q5_9ACTN|nr:HNH endonuclease signature motif containing protein [Streptomyces sp. SID12501]NEC91395.1 HNH endonuclease [Streptomyces sp. SID12501]